MRKVLLRFVFDDAWQWQNAGNELHIGAAWFMLLWVVIVAIAFVAVFQKTKNATESAMSAGFWLIVPALMGAAWFLQLPIVKSGIPVFGYGLMMFVGFSSATWLASRRVRAIGQPPEIIWDMMMWALIPGLIGARLTYLMQNWDTVFAGKKGGDLLLAAIALWDGGIVFYGSVVGGIVGVVIFCRRRKISPLAMFDVIGPSMFVGEGFGRIGCFLYGCCFGRACNPSWAVQFPPDSLTFEILSKRGTIPPDAVATIPLHPTQLYSSFAAFVLAGILACYFRRRPFDGAVLALGWILYPINRFILETLRDDEPNRWGTNFTFSQLMSMGLLISGIGAMYYFSRRGKLTKAATQADTNQRAQR
ncbi:MAG TPA: prolipoprotein diacylglyceryl transferase [Planctomycetaceae bacterium]|nr:prolipoprotein diacylglyceryl transferase [Planctomycetaceae bacterium]